jgi:hypothetical protein
MALLGISGCLGAEVGTPLRLCQSPRSYAWRSGCLSTLIVQDQDLVLFSFLDRQTSHAACFNARDYSMIAFFDALLFSSSLRPIGNLVSNRSALDLATLGILQTGQLLSWLLFFSFGLMCMLFDLSMASRLCHDPLKVVAPTHRSGACETWVPLGPHRPGSRPSPTSGSGPSEDSPT